MKTVSLVLLALVGILTLLASLVSAGFAYLPKQNQSAVSAVVERAAEGPDFATAQRARRGTAASFGAGFAVFFLMILFGPYRRGDRWAWRTILAGTLTVTILVLLRMIFLGTTLIGPEGAAGRGTVFEALLMLGLTGLGLALDAKRFKSA